MVLTHYRTVNVVLYDPPPPPEAKPHPAIQRVGDSLGEATVFG